MELGAFLQLPSSPPRDPGNRQFRDPTRIGEARPSHLVTMAGVGAMPTVGPEGYDRLLDEVVLVSRLREVRGLLGFARLAAPEHFSEIVPLNQSVDELRTGKMPAQPEVPRRPPTEVYLAAAAGDQEDRQVPPR
jgi:hypothetical protein